MSVRSQEELDLATQMSGFVASLAATGSPTMTTSRQEELPPDQQAGQAWPAWEAERQAVMVLDVMSAGGSHVEERLRSRLCDEFWASVPDRFVPIM